MIGIGSNMSVLVAGTKSSAENGCGDEFERPFPFKKEVREGELK